MQDARQQDIAKLTGELAPRIAGRQRFDLGAVRTCSIEHACALPPGLWQLRQLTSLTFRHVTATTLDMLCSGGQQLPELRHLIVFECDSSAALRTLSSDRITSSMGLKHLDLEKCYSLARISDRIDQLTHLTLLRLSCQTLTQVPASVGALTRLKHLLLEDCRSITDMPSSIGRLSGLANLQWSECPSMIQLPDSIGELTQLSHLHLSGCSALLQLPDTIGRLQNVRELNLNSCSSLTTVPSSIGRLTQLTFLELRRCNSLTHLPDTIKSLAALQKLDIARCTLLAMPTILIDLQVRGASCKVHFVYSRFAEGFGMAASDDGNALVDFQKQLRNAVAMQSLLSDRDARRATLDSIAVVAVLFATAAFVAFAQVPSVPAAFAHAQSRHAAPSLQRQAEFLRYFFVADQITFVMSMSVVMQYLVSSLPRYNVEDVVIEAGRAWLGYVYVSVLMGIAGVAGLLTFIFAAYSVYPPDLIGTDVLPLCILTVLVVIVPVALKWVSTLWQLWPGWGAMRQYGRSWYRKRELKPLLPGVDESAHSLLQASRAHWDQSKAAQAEQARHSAAQIGELHVQLERSREQSERQARQLHAEIAQLREQAVQQTAVLREVLAALQTSSHA